MSFARELFDAAKEKRSSHQVFSNEQYMEARNTRLQAILTDEEGLRNRMRNAAVQDGQFQITLASYNINNETDSELANLCHPSHRQRNRAESFLQQLQDQFNTIFNANSEGEDNTRFRVYTGGDRATPGQFSIFVSWGNPRSRPQNRRYTPNQYRRNNYRNNQDSNNNNNSTNNAWMTVARRGGNRNYRSSRQ